MSEEVEPSEAVAPWDTLTLEAMLARIQQEDCPLAMKRYGYGLGHGQWFVECGYAAGWGEDIDLLWAIKKAYTEWQAKRPKYEKRQAKRARQLAWKQAKEAQLEPVTI